MWAGSSTEIVCLEAHCLGLDLSQLDCFRILGTSQQLNEQVKEILVPFHNLLTPVTNVQQKFWISNRTSPQISKSCPRHRHKANRGDGNWAYFILAGWQSCHCNMFSLSAAHSSGRVNHDRLPLQSGLLYSIQRFQKVLYCTKSKAGCLFSFYDTFINVWHCSILKLFSSDYCLYP